MKKNIWVNEDNSYFYLSRYKKGKDITVADVEQFADKFIYTAVSTVLFCPNSMTTSVRSEVWNHVWHDYDGCNSTDHPIFDSTRKVKKWGADHFLKWVHSAWQLDRDGIDPYRIWMERSRKIGISPWISMRMNDVHYTEDEQCFIHSEYWKANPQLRQVPPDSLDDEEKARIHLSWTDKSYNFAIRQVRDYHMDYIKELAQRYDFDGLELDFMRFGVYFPPELMWPGRAILTEFVHDVRRVLDGWEKIRGHHIRLGARVPAHPDTALYKGFDAVRWAREGLIDHLVVTPFFATIDNDMPIELWKDLLYGTDVELAAGLEMCVKASPGSPELYNKPDTVRGSAISALERGADHIYLFNYFDSMKQSFNHSAEFLEDNESDIIMRELGSIEDMQNKPRRHIVTYVDTSAPGQPIGNPLPKALAKNERASFRVHIGPLPKGGTSRVVIGLTGCADDILLRINSTRCAAKGSIRLDAPAPECETYCFEIPEGALMQEYNIIELCAGGDCVVRWVELDIF